MQSTKEIKMHIDNIQYELKCIDDCVKAELDKDIGDSRIDITRFLCILVSDTAYTRATTELIKTCLQAIEDEENKPVEKELETA